MVLDTLSLVRYDEKILSTVEVQSSVFTLETVVEKIISKDPRSSWSGLFWSHHNDLGILKE